MIALGVEIKFVARSRVASLIRCPTGSGWTNSIARPDQVPLESEWLLVQHGKFEGDKSRIFLHNTNFPGVIQNSGKDLIVTRQGTGRAPDHFTKTLVIGFKRGDQQVTQTIAEEIQRGIAWVVARTESICRAINDCFFTPRIEQRPKPPGSAGQTYE